MRLISFLLLFVLCFSIAVVADRPLSRRSPAAAAYSEGTASKNKKKEGQKQPENKDKGAKDAAASSDPLACNGSREWCKLRFDQFTFAGTHNSAAIDLKLDCSPFKGFARYACPVLRLFAPTVSTCFLNNQPGHPFSKQLADGIRTFDMDTCQSDDRAVLCHGHKDVRGLGQELPEAFAEFDEFLKKNPREIVVLEFGDIAGDKVVLGKSIAKNLKEKLSQHLFEHPSRDTPWPTLAEIIKANKRLVVFFGGAIAGITPRPGWALNRGDYFRSMWFNSKHSNTADDVVGKIKHYCDKPDPKYARLWHAMDFEYMVDMSKTKDALKSFKFDHKICLNQVAETINKMVHVAVDHCFNKNYHLHRLRVDRYWQDLNLMALTDKINAANVERYVKKKGAKAQV